MEPFGAPSNTIQRKDPSTDKEEVPKAIESPFQIDNIFKLQLDPRRSTVPTIPSFLVPKETSQKTTQSSWFANKMPNSNVTTEKKRKPVFLDQDE